MNKCFCIGCGSSIKGFDFNRLKGHRTIGTNRILLDFPEVEYLVFLDRIFFDMYSKEIEEYKGLIYAPQRALPEGYYRDNVSIIDTKLRVQAGSLAGGLSGLTALNIACHWHTDRYLLGYDMYPGHYYSDAPDLYSPERAEKYGERFRQLKELWPGVKIYNCNPQSTITCFDYADIENII